MIPSNFKRRGNCTCSCAPLFCLSSLVSNPQTPTEERLNRSFDHRCIVLDLLAGIVRSAYAYDTNVLYYIHESGIIRFSVPKFLGKILSHCSMHACMLRSRLKAGASGKMESVARARARPRFHYIDFLVSEALVYGTVLPNILDHNFLSH